MYFIDLIAILKRSLIPLDGRQLFQTVPDPARWSSVFLKRSLILTIFTILWTFPNSVIFTQVLKTHPNIPQFSEFP